MEFNSQHSGSARDLAINRGLEFLYHTASDPVDFELYGYDYLGSFHCIALTSKDVRLRRLTTRWGRELARNWRAQAAIPRNAEAEDIAQLVFGSYAAAGLGVPDDAFREQLREAASHFNARDYFGFDPAVEAPPSDIPDDCECGHSNPRGRKRCQHCRKRLYMISRYGVWVDALTRTYTGERYGVRLGASFADAIKWVPAMRPYPKYDPEDFDFFWLSMR